MAQSQFKDIVVTYDDQTIHCHITSIGDKTIMYYIPIGQTDSILKVSQLIDIKTYSMYNPLIDFNKPVNDYSLIRSNMFKAGDELRKTAKQFYIGLLFQVIGSGLITIGEVRYVKTLKSPDGFLIAGGIIGGIGTVVNVTAFIHLIKAGKHLQY